MRLVVDGVVFQYGASASARLWNSVLARLATRPMLEVIVLDRGRAPSLEGVTLVPFPSYHERYTADDSLLLQKICDHYGAQVFISTTCTSPVATPMLFVLSDMTAEVLQLGRTERYLMEKEVAIAFARRFIASSCASRTELIRVFPEISEDMITVASPCLDRVLFCTRGRAEIERFQERQDLDLPYLLLEASSTPSGRLAARNVLEALDKVPSSSLAVVCVGSAPDADPALFSASSRPVHYRSFEAGDLPLALASARAFVCAAAMDGFGLPALEAMASGCPVITISPVRSHDAKWEDAGVIIDGSTAAKLEQALTAAREQAFHDRLISAGPVAAFGVSWNALVDAIERDALALAHEQDGGLFDAFFERWREMRAIQAAVDTERTY